MRQAGRHKGFGLGRASARALTNEIRNVAFDGASIDAQRERAKQALRVSDAKRKGVRSDVNEVTQKQAERREFVDNLFKNPSVPYLLICCHGRNRFRACPDCGRTTATIRAALRVGLLPNVK